MKKQKNSRFNYKRLFIKPLVLSIIIFALCLSAPTLHAFLTYYDLPEAYNELPAESRYEIYTFSYEFCVNVGYVHNLIPHRLQVRVVIDGKVVPPANIDIANIYNHSGLKDATFPLLGSTFGIDNFVCTIQPNLSIGEHEIVVFRYYNFQWQPLRWKWIVHVDESGLIR